MENKDNKLSYANYLRVCEKISEELSQIECIDLLQEVVYELTNDRWSSADDRLGGIHEVLSKVLKIEL